MKKEENIRYHLVIPASLLEEFKKAAEQDRRTVSNMIVTLAEEGLRARQAKKQTGTNEGH
jgi:mRNA-degrading endonuclease RelE of RelBE toxin-antitoxin system